MVSEPVPLSGPDVQPNKHKYLNKVAEPMTQAYLRRSSKFRLLPPRWVCRRRKIAVSLFSQCCCSAAALAHSSLFRVRSCLGMKWRARESLSLSLPPFSPGVDAWVFPWVFHRGVYVLLCFTHHVHRWRYAVPAHLVDSVFQAV